MRTTPAPSTRYFPTRKPRLWQSTAAVSQPGLYYRPRRAGRPNRAIWLVFLAAAAAAGLLLLTVMLMGGVYAFALLTHRTLPGVTVGGIPAGSLTMDELAHRLDAEWNQQKTIQLTDGTARWAVTPVEVGLWIDPQATAARAYQVGRGPRGWTEILWVARFDSLAVDPVVIYHEPSARAGLERLAAQINQPAQNPALSFQNGQWRVIPGQNGSTLNVDETVKQIAAYAQSINTGSSIRLVTQAVAPRVTDLTPILSRLQSAVDHPLILQIYDPFTNQTTPVDLPKEVFAGWVRIEGQGEAVNFTIDPQKVSAYLDEWKTQLGPEKTLEPFTPPDDLDTRWQAGEPVTVMVHYNPTRYTVQTGDTLTRIAVQAGMPYWKIQQANPQLDANQLVPGQVLEIPSKNDLLPLPVVMNKRIVVSIAQQRMWTYENGALRQEYVISTGIDRSPTYPGIYQVRTHELNAYASAWDLYMPHFMGIYEGWPGFMNGIHGLPTLSNGRLLWAGYLGRPISYGCIVMSLPDAEAVYHWAETGTIVEIQ